MALQDLEVEVRLIIRDKRAGKYSAAFGRGIADLCKGVEETGSLNRACKNMGMAYSKAWRILRNTEESLGITLLERKGAHGSVLTDDAKVLLEAFQRTEKVLKEESQVILDSVLSERS